MPKDSTPDFWTWIGFKSTMNYATLPKWMGGLIGFALTMVLLTLFVLVGATIVSLIHAVLSRNLNANPTSEDIRNLGLAAGAAIGVPFLIWRSIVAQKQVDVTEQGHITDRINKAVEGLGAEKVVKRDGDDITEPNLEVRIGALFSLERISQDSARDHVQIMEILCAYIRNNADRHSPALPDDDPPEGWRKWGENNRTHPPLDVDTALKIIERRSDDRKEIEKAYNDGEGYRLGLERSRLHTLDLRYRDLTGANLSNAHLQGTDLRKAELQGTRHWGAHLQRANLWEAKLQGASLGLAKLQGATLWDAKLQGADLGFTKLQGASLRDAKLQGANLWGAQLQGAVLSGAQFDSFTKTLFADFSRSACPGVDFSECDNLSQLQTAFGDGSTILPGGKGSDSPDWPAHWPKEKLSLRNFDTAWRAWQAEIGFQPDENPQ